MKKINKIRLSAFLIFACVHFGFLLLCLEENLPSSFVFAAFFVMLAITIIEYVNHESFLQRHDTSVTDFVNIGFCTLGTVVAYWLNNTLGWGPVGAAATLGTVVSIIPVKQVCFRTRMQLTVYCGAFVGMSSTTVLHGYAAAVLAGVICGFIYNIASGTLHGYGGRLGTIAFASVCLSCVLVELMSIWK